MVIRPIVKKRVVFSMKPRCLFITIMISILSFGLTVNTGIAEQKKWVIGFSQCNLEEPWRIQMNNEIEAASKKHPEFSVVFKNALGDPVLQTNQIVELIAKKVDLLIVAPQESAALTAPVAKAMDAGIPTLVIDRPVLGENFLCYIATDHYKQANMAGKWAVKYFKGKANIIELKESMNSVAGQLRHKGFVDALKSYPGMKIIFAVDCQWQELIGKKEMSSALTRFDKIDLVYGHNDSLTHGAYLAALAEGKGREKTIKFIGIDALLNEGIKYVREGIFAATFENPTGATEAIKVAYKYLHDGVKPPKKIALGTRAFYPGNLDKEGK